VVLTVVAQQCQAMLSKDQIVLFITLGYMLIALMCPPVLQQLGITATRIRSSLGMV
jgi:hypothetical protein